MWKMEMEGERGEVGEAKKERMNERKEGGGCYRSHYSRCTQSPPCLCQFVEYQGKSPILRVSTVGE